MKLNTKYGLITRENLREFSRHSTYIDAIRRDIRQYEDDFISFRILSSTYDVNERLNSTDQLFIYTQVPIEILFDMEHQSNTKLDSANFYYSEYQDNRYQLGIIMEFQNDYNPSSFIRWFT